MPLLTCDNWEICGQAVADRGSADVTEARARAGGWHIFQGTTYGGQEHRAVLCPKCIGMRGRALHPAVPLLDSQLELFEEEPDEQGTP